MEMSMSDEIASWGTMLAWFLQNYEQAPPNPFDESFSAAFGSGGHPADDFLAPRFAHMVSQSLLAEVSVFLPGLWVQKPKDANLDAANTRDDYEALLPGLLESLASNIRRLPARRVGRDHNKSPEGLVESDDLPDEFLPITEPEKEVILRATKDARLAVLSNDNSALQVAWEIASPILSKIAGSISNQITLMMPHLRPGLAALAIVLVGTEFDIVTQAQAVQVAMVAIGGAAAKDFIKK
jgi:hypothetical protein